MPSIDIGSEQMVLGPATENERPTNVEQATVAVENSNIEEIAWVDPHITGVIPIKITTFVDDLWIITENGDSNIDDERNG